MKIRGSRLRITIPMILLFYTGVMLIIQLGIPNTQDLEDEVIVPPNDPKLDGILGQKWILHIQQEAPNVKMSQDQVRVHSDTPVKKKSVFKKLANSVYVYSAYLENRQSENHKIKIIVLRKLQGEAEIQCHFRIRGNFYRNVTASYKELSENHGRQYGGWMYECVVPISVLAEHKKRKTQLSYMSLSSGGGPLAKVKIGPLTLIKAPPKHQLGLCVPPLFGELSISAIIQFIELWKILGASHFTFYLHDISFSISNLLNFYQSRGEVTLLNWHLPDHIQNTEIWYHGQLLAIQDCLYRNMSQFHYLSFVDLDEFIIPTKNFTLLDMIQDLESSGIYSDSFNTGLSFKSTYFAPNQILDTEQYLTYLQLLMRTKTFSSTRTKLVVQPGRVEEMGIHHVSRHLQRLTSVVDVEPEVAKVHHYRSCAKNFNSDTRCVPEVRDDVILKYADKLVTNYKNIIRKSLPLFMPKD